MIKFLASDIYTRVLGNVSLTVPNAFRFTIKDQFLDNPRIDSIFPPIELEEQNND